MVSILSKCSHLRLHSVRHSLAVGSSQSGGSGLLLPGIILQLVVRRALIGALLLWLTAGAVISLPLADSGMLSRPIC